MLATFHGAVRRLRASPAMTVAAVSGWCLGGGLELAAACDLLVAADDAVFGQPEVDLGCFPPLAAALYPARVGAGRTLDWLVTGRRFGAGEAVAAGLAARAVPTAELAGEIRALVAAVTGKSAAVTRLIKRAVAAGAEAGPGSGFARALAECERIYREELVATADMAEGVAAFLEKRPPAWRHR
jgi:cyclohexa-1,5-dienecarbonyl-CoA hydratase